MVIPIYDNDPLEKDMRAYVTWALIATNIVVFLLQQGASDTTTAALARIFALTPAAVDGKASYDSALPAALTLVTYMFLHGGWLHIIFNMLFLWVFGDNVEDAMGHGRFLAFYLLCGVAGGLAHMLSAPESNIPLVGASGAVAGVIAAYLMLRPCAKVTVLIFTIIPVKLDAFWVLGFWALSQVWHILTAEPGETAWWAHIGGLIAGALLVIVMRKPDVLLFDCLRPGEIRLAARPDSTGDRGPWGAR